MFSVTAGPQTLTMTSHLLATVVDFLAAAQKSSSLDASRSWAVVHWVRMEVAVSLLWEVSFASTRSSHSLLLQLGSQSSQEYHTR